MQQSRLDVVCERIGRFPGRFEAFCNDDTHDLSGELDPTSLQRCHAAGHVAASRQDFTRLDLLTDVLVRHDGKNTGDGLRRPPINAADLAASNRCRAEVGVGHAFDRMVGAVDGPPGGLLQGINPGAVQSNGGTDRFDEGHLLAFGWGERIIVTLPHREAEF